MNTKQTIITLFAAALSATVCAQTADYTVSGVLKTSGLDGKKIYIERYDDSRIIDSTNVDGNKFLFRGKIDRPCYCRIQVGKYGHANVIVEGGNVIANVDRTAYNQPSGTPQNNEMRRIEKEEEHFDSAFYARIKVLRQQYPDSAAFDREEKKIIEERNRLIRKRGDELFSAHSDDAVGFYLLYGTYFNFRSPEERERIIAGLGPWLKSTEKVKKLSDEIAALKRTAPGQMFADVSGRDTGGNPVSLSDFIGKGKYLLVDFWSSWCGPCKQEIPNLVKLHNAYKDKGLQLVGLFVWDKEHNMAKAVKNEGIGWPQIFDAKNVAMKRYGISGIPQIMLISPDGRIMKRNLRGEYLIKYVSEIMDSK